MTISRGLTLSLAFLILGACSRTAVITSGAPPADLPQKLMPGELETECNALYNKNARGKRISWKGQTPIAFRIDPSFPPEFVPVIRAAMTSWNAAAGYALFEIRDGAANSISLLAADALALRKSMREAFGDDAQVAVTRSSYVGNRIFRSDIYFDAVNANLSASVLRLNSYDVETVALHELGHVLGLKHNPSAFTSVMFPTAVPFGFSLRRVDTTSQRLLDCEYK